MKLNYQMNWTTLIEVLCWVLKNKNITSHKIKTKEKKSPEGESNTRSQDYNEQLQSRALANWAIRRISVKKSF